MTIRSSGIIAWRTFLGPENSCIFNCPWEYHVISSSARASLSLLVLFNVVVSAFFLFYTSSTTFEYSANCLGPLPNQHVASRFAWWKWIPAGIPMTRGVRTRLWEAAAKSQSPVPKTCRMESLKLLILILHQWACLGAFLRLYTGMLMRMVEEYIPNCLNKVGTWY